MLPLQLQTFCRQMLFQSLYFLPQPFCSSAHTFHGTTRSHQAGSCHRVPSKEEDFNFLGYIFQMPENAESKKISHSDNHTMQMGGHTWFCPQLQERATPSRSVLCTCGTETFSLKICWQNCSVLECSPKKAPKTWKTGHCCRTHSHRRWAPWFPFSL